MAHTIPSGSLREKSTKEKTDNEWIRIGNLCAYAYTMHTHMYTYILYIIYAPGSLAWLKGTSAGNQVLPAKKRGETQGECPGAPPLFPGQVLVWFILGLWFSS